MSDGPILVRLRRNQSGSQWGFTMQGGYDQGSCLYIQKVRNRVYTSYSFGNTIFVHIGESDLACLVSLTTCARPQLKPRFKSAAETLHYYFRATCCNPSVHPVNLAIVSSSLHVSVI